MAEKFYAVAFGYKRGIYEKWADCQKQTTGFPQPVFKKFETRGEAEEFVKSYEPTEVTFDVDKDSKVFYAVPRAKVAGVFTDFSVVKQHIADYPKPLQKKFPTFEEAKAYYEKYANGVEGETEKEAAGDAESDDKDEKKSPSAKQIARKRTHGKTDDEEEEEKVDEPSEKNGKADDASQEKRTKVDGNANVEGETEKNVSAKPGASPVKPTTPAKSN